MNPSFMMVKQTHNRFCSVRKLMIAYQVLQSSKKKLFTISNFIFPSQYPQSFHTNTWEAFRIVKCLINLKDWGIHIHQIHLQPSCLTILKPIQYKELHFPKGITKDFTKPLKLSIKQVLKLLTNTSNEHIDKDGEGTFLPIPKRSFQRQALQNALPAFLKFSLKIDRKLLKKSLFAYLKQYKQGQLKHIKGNYFGYSFCQSVFDDFFQKLSFRQGKHIQFYLGNKTGSKRNGQDEFTQAFQQHHPEEYTLWKRGTYHFPFFEHLLNLERQKKVEIQKIKVDRAEKKCPNSYEELLRYYGYDDCELRANMQIVIKPDTKKKPSSSIGKQRITLVEIVESPTNEFMVYINQDYLHPIMLNKRQKSSKLIYTLAAEGYADYDDYVKTFEYIQTDKRFKFFARTNYMPTRLLDRDTDGYIIPATPVVFQLIDERDLHKIMNI